MPRTPTQRTQRGIPSPDARPTMRDVASAANVSFKTVARVVHGEPWVRAETAARVNDAIRRLGYQPNEIASSLKRGVSRETIGLVIADVANPFFATIARAVEDVARERRLLLITASIDEDPEREREVIDSLVKQRVTGLLLVPVARDHRFLSKERRMGMPIVFMDRPPGMIRADTVLMDNLGGARSAVDHLIAHGHQRIAILGDRLEVHTMRERFAGYQQALAAASMEADDALARFDCHSSADAETRTRELLALPSPPTAVFGTNNRMTIGAALALAHQRRRVALIGFDDFELATALTPPISVVTTDTEDLGSTAARMLLRRLDGWTGAAERVVLPTRLVIRGSGEIHPDGPSRSR
ncbi:MAG: LacI family transcriptional regulator [Chloroflexi bacterium]|nr:LacI family transcriptional regulator [Chloroflexota bacterium]